MTGPLTMSRKENMSLDRMDGRSPCTHETNSNNINNIHDNNYNNKLRHRRIPTNGRCCQQHATDETAAHERRNEPTTERPMTHVGSGGVAQSKQTTQQRRPCYLLQRPHAFCACVWDVCRKNTCWSKATQEMPLYIFIRPRFGVRKANKYQRTHTRAQHNQDQVRLYIHSSRALL